MSEKLDNKEKLEDIKVIPQKWSTWEVKVHWILKENYLCKSYLDSKANILLLPILYSKTKLFTESPSKNQETKHQNYLQGTQNNPVQLEFITKEVWLSKKFESLRRIE